MLTDKQRAAERKTVARHQTVLLSILQDYQRAHREADYSAQANTYAARKDVEEALHYAITSLRDRQRALSITP